MMTFLNLSQPFVSSEGNMKNIVIHFSLSILSKWFEGLSMLAIQNIILRIKKCSLQ
jgi:Na+/proline symporter